MKDRKELLSTMNELNRMLSDIIHMSKEYVEENKAIIDPDYKSRTVLLP